MLIGLNFVFSLELRCRFDQKLALLSQVTPAIWIDESIILCITPKGFPGQANIFVTVNGIDYIPSNEKFLYTGKKF